MRVALIGQQKFGQAVIDALLARGHEVAAVFCAPDKPGAVADPVKTGALAHGIPVHQLASLRAEPAAALLRDLSVDLLLMAYVLQFVPRQLTAIARHGTIQYHPSLLPRYRGPSSINWPIIRGDTVTGLTIFRPTDGLDEGPVILQKETPIGPDDTLGSVYFDRLFPLGVAALIEAAELVVRGDVPGAVQDEAAASYEGWCRGPEARINWHSHVDIAYNLIRGCDPAPGAWTTWSGKTLQVFEARKHPIRRFAEVAGEIGAISAVGERSIRVNAQGGQIEIFKVRLEDGGKTSAAQFVADAGLAAGAVLGS